MKKLLIGIIVFSLMFVMAANLVAAQYTDVSASFKTAMGSIAGILGGTVDALIAIPLKVLFFLVLVIVLNMAARPIFRNRGISFIVAILVSALGMQALPAGWLTTFLATYGALAAVILVGLPIIILWFFSMRYINTPLFTPLWITAAVVFFFLTMNYGFGVQEFSKPIYGAFSMVAGVISFVVVLNKGWLKKMRNRGLRERHAHLSRQRVRLDAEFSDRNTPADRRLQIEDEMDSVNAELTEIDHEIAGQLL